MIPRGRPTGPPGGPGRSAVDDPQLPGLVVQDDRAGRTADDDVLDPGAVASRHVDPRLDAEGHPRRERLAVARDEVWVLVTLQPDPMAGPVEELLAVALAIDDVTGRPVDRLRRGS